jgi:hypothetical protein
MGLRDILKEVAGKHGALPAELCLPSGTKKAKVMQLTRARQHFYFRALTETKLSSARIGLFCNRDGATVRYGGARYALRTGAELPRGWRPSRATITRFIQGKN